MSTHTATYSPSTHTDPLLPYTLDWILSPSINPLFQAFSGWCSWMLITKMKHSHRHPTKMGLLDNQHTLSTQKKKKPTLDTEVHLFINTSDSKFDSKYTSIPGLVKVWTLSTSSQHQTNGLWPLNPAPGAGSEPLTCLTPLGSPSSWFSDTNCYCLSVWR